MKQKEVARWLIICVLLIISALLILSDPVVYAALYRMYRQVWGQ